MVTPFIFSLNNYHHDNINKLLKCLSFLSDSPGGPHAKCPRAARLKRELAITSAAIAPPFKWKQFLNPVMKGRKPMSYRSPVVFPPLTLSWPSRCQTLWLLVLVMSLMAGVALAGPPKEDVDLLGDFDADPVILPKLGEKVSISQLSLKPFSCLERITVKESGKGVVDTADRNLEFNYTVTLKVGKNPTLQRIFEEKRFPVDNSSPVTAPGAEVKLDYPTIDKPFGGFLANIFSMENRMANDFKPAGDETLNGFKCAVLAFESTPELSGLRIPLMDQWVSLRLRGRIWVDRRTYRLVRITALLQKLPKGWKSFGYTADFSLVPVIGPEVFLPVRLEIKAEYNQRTFLAVQEYSNFKVLPLPSAVKPRD
jgi:hypothetical protein